MSLAGFKKQISKANQRLNEKVHGAQGTELDGDFKEMERKVDVANKMMEELINKTHEYLQPNPMARAKMTAMRGLNNLQSKSRSSEYPQPETVLGDCMSKFGNDYGQDCGFGNALVKSGDAFKQMAEVKRNMEDSVKQNFLDPISSLQQRDLREISQHRKKLEGRRLDFDCKKRKGAGRNDEDLASAEEKFEESKSAAERAMSSFVNADAEHVGALTELIEAELEYHEAAAKILSDLRSQLRNSSSSAAAAAPARRSAAPSAGAAQGRGNSGSGSQRADDGDDCDGPAPTISMKPRHESAKAATPTCRALYAFTADSKTELAFEEGDTIRLLAKIDSNWFEGELKGKRGYFPVSYVNVIVPLPENE